MKKVDLPVFGIPTISAWVGCFFIDSFFPLPDFFAFACFSFSFLYLVLRFESMFSLDLCFGHSLIISSKYMILSSSV